MKSVFGQVFPINSLPACRLVSAGIDRISTDADVKFEACRRYYQQVDSDVLFFFSDIVIQAEAMGAPVSISEGAMPGVSAPAWFIDVPLPSDCPRMQVNVRTTRRLKTAFPEKKVSILVYGPFTVAGQLVGEQRILKNVVQKPDEVKTVLDKTLVLAKSYAAELMAAGADILWISDPLAALLPPGIFWSFAGRYLKEIFDSYSKTPSVLHICGDTTDILQQMAAIGVWAISFDQCMDLLRIEDELDRDVWINCLRSTEYGFWIWAWMYRPKILFQPPCQTMRRSSACRRLSHPPENSSKQSWTWCKTLKIPICALSWAVLPSTI
jgi:uroporphyrinogen-III decarboxylase